MSSSRGEPGRDVEDLREALAAERKLCDAATRGLAAEREKNAALLDENSRLQAEKARLEVNLDNALTFLQDRAAREAEEIRLARERSPVVRLEGAARRLWRAIRRGA